MKRPLPLLMIVFAILMCGCFQTLADRWAAFDARMKEDVGVKTAQDYYTEWGRPAKQRNISLFPLAGRKKSISQVFDR